MTIVVIRKAANDSHQAQTLTLKSPRPETKEATPSPIKTRPKTVARTPVCGKPASPDRPATPRNATPRNAKRTPQAQEKRDMILTPTGRFVEGPTVFADEMNYHTKARP